MAEIKSTLELAMERTKRLTISQEEKEEIKRKELLETATALFHRYRDGHAPLNEIQKEIEKLDEKISVAVKKILLSEWIEALSWSDEGGRFIKGIELLKGGNVEEVSRRFHSLLSQYQKEKEEAQERVRTHSVETLRKEGISGSAVEPNIEKSPLWKREFGNLDENYGARLEELRERLRAL